MRATRNSMADRSDPMVAVRNDIAAIRKDVTALVGNRMGAVSDAVLGHISDVRAEARNLVGKAKKTVGAAHEQLSEAAGARPLTTIAVSALAGIVGAKVLGWMMRR